MPCKDGYVALSPRSDQSWRDLCAFFEAPELAEDPRFAAVADRTRNATDLEELLEPYIAEYTMEELFRGLGPLRVLVGMTLDVPSLVDDPHLKERELFSTVRHPVAGDVVMPMVPFKMSETPGNRLRPAPLLGQHNLEVYSEIGLSCDDLTVLRGAGVI